jgi:hypothetical protein
MTQEHPITPPEKLVDQWNEAWIDAKVKHEGLVTFIATQAARWGADQELEACVEWASCFNYDDYRYDEVLRDIRRSPEPPSLKEQALKMLDDVERFTEGDYYTIRCALESLPD